MKGGWKSIFIFLTSLFLTVCMGGQAWADLSIDWSNQYARMNAATVGAATAGAASPCAGYLICQGFEGTGYDNSESWTEYENNASADVNEDYTTTVLDGSQSMQVVYTSYDGDRSVGTYADFSAQGTIGFYAMFRTSNASVEQDIAVFADSGGTERFRVYVTSAAVLRVTCGNSATSVDTLSADTTYHIWGDFTKTTSCSAGFSTDTTKPSSGNKYTSNSSSVPNADLTRIKLGDYMNTNGANKIFDKVRVKSSAIGSNPD